MVVALNMAHHRFIIPKEALKFDIKKIDPISNAKEKFFSLNPIVEFVKSLMKLFLLGYIVWNVVGSQWTTFPTLLWSTPIQALSLLHETVWDIFWGCIPMIIVIAIFDFGYQWYDNRKELMMSRQELKDEMKNTDGNPEVKAQQRKRAHQRLQATIKQKRFRPLMWLSSIRLTSLLPFDMTSQRLMHLWSLQRGGFSRP